MQTPEQKLQTAMQHAMAHRPTAGGFPFLAECLRQAGVEKNVWTLPACQSVYVMSDGVVVQQGTPLVTGLIDVPIFDQEKLITALQTDQAGQSTFPEFLMATWNAGVIGYDVDFLKRKVTYKGSQNEEYVESYPEMEVLGLKW